MHAVVETFSQDELQIPPIDCRPYPVPDKLILADIEPQNRPDGWLFTHEDYKALSDMVDSMIRFMEQAREVPAYFVACEAAYNEKIKKLSGKSE